MGDDRHDAMVLGQAQRIRELEAKLLAARSASLQYRDAYEGAKAERDEAVELLRQARKHMAMWGECDAFLARVGSEPR